MRAMKRTVSVLLSLMLVLGMVTMGISVASAAETKTVTVKSNIAADATQTITADSEQVTVTYKLKAAQPVVEGQGVITFDQSVLKVAASNTADTFFPNIDPLRAVNFGKEGRIPFNFSNVSTGYDFSEEAVLVTVVFDIVSTADTTVELDMDVLTATKGNPKTAADDVVIIDGDVNNTNLYTASTETAVYPEGVDPAIFIQDVRLALEGKIGINYYVIADPEGYERSKMSVQFVGPNDEENTTVAYSNMTIGKRNGVMVGRHTYYLKSYMMTQPVVAKFMYDGVEVASYSMAITDWADANIPTFEASNPNAVRLIKTMLNYGAASQVQFDRYTDNLANKNVDLELETIDPSIIEVESGSNVAPNLSSMAATWQRQTAELKDGIALRLYIKANNVNTFAGKVSCGGADLPFQTSTGSTVMMAVKDNIYSYDMDTSYTFEFSNGATYKTSVMSYVKQTMINNSSNQNVINLCSAMYWYNQAANVHFGK